jgi:predicted Rossmann fold flavoprotein
MPKITTTCIIIGAGAAGYFCAINLAQQRPDIKVILLEASNKVLSKVRISGGGRCNVTNNQSSPAEMSKCYPRGNKYVKKLFQNFFVSDTLQWFEERGVPIIAEPDGRMFPRANTSEAIIECFQTEAKKAKIEVLLSHKVQEIVVDTKFTVISSSASFSADYVVITTGGFQKLSQFDLPIKLKHSISDPVPSLFTFNFPKHAINSLMGVSVPHAMVRIRGFNTTYSGPVLITHWGLSGPAVLKLSAYAARFLHEENYRYTVHINWCPTYNENTMLELLREYRNTHARQMVYKHKITEIPARLWHFMLQQCDIAEQSKWGELAAKQQNLLAKYLCDATYEAQGKTTYKDEFVTAGGVVLQDIDSATCMSKLVPKLYFAGEVLDCDGITGGFNFQHAWSSAWAVAKSIAQSTKS